MVEAFKQPDRGWLRAHMVQCVAEDTQRRHCVELVQIGFGSGRTDAWLLNLGWIAVEHGEVPAKHFANSKQTSQTANGHRFVQTSRKESSIQLIAS